TGLFTAIAIYKDEMIAVFGGERLSALEAKLRAEAGNDRYFMNLPDGGILDAMHVKCFAKYANDAEGVITSAFKNNARITLDENNAVCMQAKRNIKADEELFCGYGKRYWRKHG
ncbi:MAG: SET domain-containing protein, partial [Flavobacteriales bacterium]